MGQSLAIKYRPKTLEEILGQNITVKILEKTVEKRDSEGNVISKVKVGTPSLMRKGVSNYKIERIFSDNEGRNLIFVVEKLMEDETGISVRYMIEATKF